MNLSDKQRQARDIVVFKGYDERGVSHDVDAKAYYPDGTEVQCQDERPPQTFEVWRFSCDS